MSINYLSYRSVFTHEYQLLECSEETIEKFIYKKKNEARENRVRKKESDLTFIFKIKIVNMLPKDWTSILGTAL